MKIIPTQATGLDHFYILLRDVIMLLRGPRTKLSNIRVPGYKCPIIWVMNMDMNTCAKEIYHNCTYTLVIHFKQNYFMHWWTEKKQNSFSTDLNINDFIFS